MNINLSAKPTPEMATKTSKEAGCRKAHHPCDEGFGDKAPCDEGPYYIII